MEPPRRAWARHTLMLTIVIGIQTAEATASLRSSFWVVLASSSGRGGEPAEPGGLSGRGYLEDLRKGRKVQNTDLRAAQVRRRNASGVGRGPRVDKHTA